MHWATCVNYAVERLSSLPSVSNDNLNGPPPFNQSLFNGWDARVQSLFAHLQVSPMSSAAILRSDECRLFILKPFLRLIASVVILLAHLKRLKCYIPPPPPSPRLHFPFLWVCQMLKHWKKTTTVVSGNLRPMWTDLVGMGDRGGVGVFDNFHIFCWLIIFIYSVETVSPFLWSSLIYFACLHVTTGQFVFLSPTSNASDYCLQPSSSKCVCVVWVCSPSRHACPYDYEAKSH